MRPRPTERERRNGRTVADDNDDRPTFIIWLTVDSRPTWKSSRITPSRAIMSTEASVFRYSSP